MRILLIHQYFLERNGSGGSRFNEMTQVWAKQGHQVTVIAGMVHYSTGEKAKKYKGKWILTDKEFYTGVDVIRTHVSESYNKSYVGRFWAYISFVLSSIWAGLFKVKGKFDLVLVTSPPLFVGFTALVLSLLKRTPFVFEIRDLWPESAIDSGIVSNKHIIKLSYWFEAYIYKKAKLINVLTPAFRKKPHSKEKCPGRKDHIYPQCCRFYIIK